MEKENINPNSDISGATKSVPQVASVFSYPVKGGDISLYLVEMGFAKVAVMTFDDTYSEYAYAVQTITSNPTSEAYELVENAEKAFHNPLMGNPFTKLLHDNEAMTRLIIIFRTFLSGE